MGEKKDLAAGDLALLNQQLQATNRLIPQEAVKIFPRLARKADHASIFKHFQMMRDGGA